MAQTRTLSNDPGDAASDLIATSSAGDGAHGLADRLAGAIRFVLADPPLAIPVVLFAVLVLFALVVPFAWTQSPLKQDLFDSLQGPSASHPLGTDSLGRDILARVASGARISLVVATLVSAAGALVGGTLGLAAGALSGLLDGLLMRAMDAILAFPPLILALAVTVGLGAGLRSAAMGITLVSIPWYARLVRSEAIRIRGLPFIEAAAAIGCSRKRIVVRHIVPHMLSTLFIQTAAVFGYAILALAGLGFVGLGAQVPTPEWGAMITDGLGYALTGQWWISVFPGLGILIAATTASMISDRVRDLLDPRGHYARL